LPGGVKVAQVTLTHLVLVRIQAGQPLIIKELRIFDQSEAWATVSFLWHSESCEVPPILEIFSQF
jgi:hypothetical protein